MSRPKSLAFYHKATGMRWFSNTTLHYAIQYKGGSQIEVTLTEETLGTERLKTYLWYFNVESFDEFRGLSEDEIATTINKQVTEKYFYPMPLEQVMQYTAKLIDNTIKAIGQAINDVRNRNPDFTSTIKNIAAISCIFDEDCEVKIELDDIGSLSSYYSLIGTREGHMPVPIFLEFIEAKGANDKEDINLVKNVLYFIRGYGTIKEEEREHDADDVRGAASELFQKAIVLYNKLRDDEGEECPEFSLPDGLGYCRDFDYGELMKKSEEELAKDIVESLIKIRRKMVEERLGSLRKVSGVKR